MKKIVIISTVSLFLFSLFLLSGCGALVTALIQVLLGTKIGFVFVPAVVAAKADDTEKKDRYGCTFRK